MNVFQRFFSLFRSSSSRRRARLYSIRRNTIECIIKLLDNSQISLLIKRTALSCELINQVLIQLDIIERDFFGLAYRDTKGHEFWVDPLKKLEHHFKNMKYPYTFEFRVKFYAIDPDQLNEELTRYHFFLQLKQDIVGKKLKLNEDMVVELAALSIQSEIGDYEPGIVAEDYIKEALLDKNLNEDCIKKIESRHKELMGYNPGQCEVEFLRRIKLHEYYGMHRYEAQTDSRQLIDLGFTPSGIVMIRDNQKIAFYSWNRVNLIGFKNKNIKLLIHNRLDPNLIDKQLFVCSSTKIAKNIWKSAIEYHSFFRLLKANRIQSTQKISRVFTSNFRYSGRTFYEANENAARASRRKTSFKRSKTMAVTQRSTSGYIRLGSRVFCRAENGEYFRGEVVALSDKVYVRCDDGVTIAHHKNTTDGIVNDSNPDFAEIKIGTRVIAHWSGISNYLPGNISSIEGEGLSANFLVSFDDGDNQWNSLEKIRLLKPPVYFGPGSNSTFLQKKFSMIKSTNVVNSKLEHLSRTEENIDYVESSNCDLNHYDLVPETKPRCNFSDNKESLSEKFTRLTLDPDVNGKAAKVLISSQI